LQAISTLSNVGLHRRREPLDEAGDLLLDVHDDADTIVAAVACLAAGLTTDCFLGRLLVIRHVGAQQVRRSGGFRRTMAQS
jgi:hypothetical protein